MANNYIELDRSTVFAIMLGIAPEIGRMLQAVQAMRHGNDRECLYTWEMLIKRTAEVWKR